MPNESSRQSQVQTQLNELLIIQEKLTDVVSSFESRLAHVLTPARPIESDVEKAQQNLVSFAEAMRDLRSRFVFEMDRLIDLHDRLEI